MKAYLVRITMHDGSRGRYRGLFANDWDAICSILEAFGDAKSVTPRRLTA